MSHQSGSRALRAARWAAPVAAAALIVIALNALNASASARGGTPRVVVGDTPATVNSVSVGPVAPASRLALTVVLKPRDPSGLAALAAAVSNPNSASYRHFLNVDAFAARFGASSASVRLLRRTLSRDGLQAGSLSRNGLSIGVSGTAAAASRAFDVTLRRYRERSGREIFANTDAPRLPAALGGVVADVLGLDDGPAAVPEGLSETARAGGAAASASHVPTGEAHTLRRATAHSASGTFTGNAGPAACAAAAGFAAKHVGTVNTISQVADAYRYDGLYADGDFGQGATVALLELEPYTSESSDLAAFESCYGINAPVSDIDVDGGSPLSGPLYFSTAETAVDLENLLGLAPDVSVNVYYGPNDAQGQYDTLGAIVDAPPDQHAQVINNSWGLCEQDSPQATVDAENSLLEEAATQGQTFFSSSGDRGAEGCALEWNNNLTTQSVPTGSAPATDLAVDDPASQPWAIGVGGTNLNGVGPPPIESAWEQLDWGASGGGISTIWQMPSWQLYSGVPGVLSSSSSATPCGASAGQYCREVPDVSADGSTQTGYVTYYQGAWAGFGGTSTSAPDWAALAALADSAVMGDESPGVPVCTTQTPGAPLGFLDPLLYEVDAGDAHADAFNDVTSGENSGYFVGDVPYGAYPVTPGYDMVTGLGTPIASDGSGPGLVSQLCEAADTPPGSSAIVSGLSAPEASVGATITIDGSGFTPFAAVWFGSVAASQVAYDGPTQLTVAVPPGSGSVPVTVIKISGVSQANVDATFTYAPTETISSPAPGATYTQGQSLTASYSCAASTGAAPSCNGPVPNGAGISTANVGTQQFTVSATDANGVTTTTTSTYSVVAPPAIAIAGISSGGTYAQGQAISAQVTCTTTSPITISSCTAPATINTSAPGTYSFDVVATDSNGVTTTEVISYSVVAAPKATITTPASGAYYLLRQSLTASFSCVAVAPAHIVSCAGPVASGASVDTSTLGPHRFEVTATDSSGIGASATASYTVVALRARITNLRQAASRWIEAARRGSKAKTPVGTRFTFTLDQPAHVTLSFARSLSGRVKGQQCVAAALAATHARPCTNSVRAGKLAVAGEPGSNTVAFSGRTSAGQLPAGTYTVVVQATGLSGRPSAIATLLFTIAPAKRA